MTTVPEIANRLASLCNDHKFVDAYTELFSDDAISLDPIAGPEPVKGLPTLIEREKAFFAANDIHDVKVSDPIFAGNYFSVVISMHFTPKDAESKMVEELAVYKVDKGRIVSQQFFIG